MTLARIGLSILLSGSCEQFAGMFASGLGNGLTGQHAGDLLDALRAIEFAKRDLGPTAVNELIHHKMLVGERRDLRLMCNAQHLLRAAELFKLQTNRFRDAAANTDVHLV